MVDVRSYGVVIEAGCLIGRARCLARPRMVNALTVCIMLYVHFLCLCPCTEETRVFCMVSGQVVRKDVNVVMPRCGPSEEKTMMYATSVYTGI